MKRGTLALALIALGFLVLVLAGLASTLFAAADQSWSGPLALGLLVGGAALVILGFVVRLFAPKPMPDNEYDHDLPQN